MTRNLNLFFNFSQNEMNFIFKQNECSHHQPVNLSSPATDPDCHPSPQSPNEQAPGQRQWCFLFYDCITKQLKSDGESLIPQLLSLKNLRVIQITAFLHPRGQETKSVKYLTLLIIYSIGSLKNAKCLILFNVAQIFQHPLLYRGLLSLHI